MALDEHHVQTLGMSLPPDVCRRVALRLLDTVAPDAAFAVRSEQWLRTEAAVAYDALNHPVLDASRLSINTSDIGRVVRHGERVECGAGGGPARGERPAGPGLDRIGAAASAAVGLGVAAGPGGGPVTGSTGRTFRATLCSRLRVGGAVAAGRAVRRAGSGAR